MSRLSDLAEYVEHFRQRVVQDAIAEATSSYWLRRAAAFDRVNNDRCRAIAQACRNAARVALIQDAEVGPEPVVCDVCGTPTSPWSCSCGETRIDGAA